PGTLVPTPWMSILLGPLSETMSSVSWRDWAFDGDQTAGAAGSTLPAASAVMDLRNARRCICNLPLCYGLQALPQRSCHSFLPAGAIPNRLGNKANSSAQ